MTSSKLSLTEKDNSSLKNKLKKDKKLNKIYRN